MSSSEYLNSITRSRIPTPKYWGLNRPGQYVPLSEMIIAYTVDQLVRHQKLGTASVGRLIVAT
jgi:hypothetical protein